MENVEPDVSLPKGNMNAEAAALARQRGWVEPQQYDYEAYNASSKPDEDSGNVPDLPAWAANAVKYEWNESYGDIGPPDPKLEEMLFRNEYLNRAGIKFDQYVCWLHRGRNPETNFPASVK